METLDDEIRRFLAPSGYGYGYDSGYGVKSLNKDRIYSIDTIPTIIRQVRGNIARGYLVECDFSLHPIWVVRRGNVYAHGTTLHIAAQEAEDKYRQTAPVEERISAFVEAHPDPDLPYGDLFKWHNTLTGSCTAGRESWCRNHGYKPTDQISVRTFIEKTANDYGGDIIKQLEKHYQI